jgi:hypothetical protein
VEACGCLVALPVFNTGVAEHLGQAGSIPVRLRQTSLSSRVPPCRPFVEPGVSARLRPPAAVVAALLQVGLLPPAAAQAAPSARAVTTVSVSGRVVDTTGRPVSGAVVTVGDNVPGLLIAIELFACVFSLAAVLDPLACGPHAVTATIRADGTFTARLPKGSPVQRAGTLRLSVRGMPVAVGLTGALTSTTRPYDGRTRSLGDLPLWQPELRQVRDGDRVRMDVDPPPGAKSFSMRLRSAGEKGVAWHLPVSKQGEIDVDARVLEPGTRSADGYADGAVAGHRAGFWSAGRPVAPAVAAPVSRKRPCSTYQDGGALMPIAGCPFTDGRLATELGLHEALRLVGRPSCQYDDECSAPAAPNAFVLDLGEVRVMRAVLLRDCGCQVELSLDGTRWYPWLQERREGTAGDVVVTGAPVPAQHVRLVGDVFTSWRLREVSVFADRPLPVPVTVPPLPARPPAPPVAPALPAPATSPAIMESFTARHAQQGVNSSMIGD